MNETLKNARLKAHWSIAQLAIAAGIDKRTVSNAENGTAIFDYKAQAIVDALAKKLNQELTIQSLEIKTV